MSDATPNPLPDPPSAKKIFYQCQRCTACCRWPGFVRITEEEIPRMAAHIGVSEDDFIQNYTRLTPRRNGLALIDKPNGECFFLEGRDCRLQAVKPKQCAGFPNTWNFPGWREICEAIPVEVDPAAPLPFSK
ncbi:MAG TPA: YkgJ family cysteine cluster protein [Chthoniobacteraceae bacterium]|nr:YkgJ family cysteine cluster protein [Chthoniobacteraceae bacterium]